MHLPNDKPEKKSTFFGDLPNQLSVNRVNPRLKLFVHQPSLPAIFAAEEESRDFLQMMMSARPLNRFCRQQRVSRTRRNIVTHPSADAKVRLGSLADIDASLGNVGSSGSSRHSIPN
jgi:hypothetical protein